MLEARDRVGGRTEGMLLDDRTPLELGGQWLGEGHTRMAELVAELGLATFRTYNDEGELLLELGGKRSRMASHKGAMPKLSPFVLADLAQGLARFERLAKRVGDLAATVADQGCRPPGRADLGELDPAQPAHPDRPGVLQRSSAKRSGPPSPRTCRCSTRCSTPAPTRTSRR